MRKLTDKEILQVERQKTAALQSALLKAGSDIDYLAMMSGVDLDTETEGDDEQV
ncbi:MAG: hypothetical protein LKK00_01540 [Intestinimonas sp.]|jgi:hypothetical protein|nr:hypothetical protein [Intestinimonas sp.]